VQRSERSVLSDFGNPLAHQFERGGEGGGKGGAATWSALAASRKPVSDVTPVASIAQERAKALESLL
jgi:hypothetical protein